MAIATTEFDLVVGLRARDEDAFESLVALYGPRIRVWASRHVLDQTEIEDIVQDVLLSVWRSSPTLREDTTLAPWLKTVTDNACRMRARTASRRPAMPAGLVPDGARPMPAPDVATLLDVEHALTQLPAREAGILRLLYTEDLGLDEAASRMNVSAAAAKSLAARARRRFRGMFDTWFRVAGFVAIPIQRAFPFVRAAETVDAPARDAVKTGLAAAAAIAIAVAGSGAAQRTHPAERPRAAAPVRTAPVATTDAADDHAHAASVHRVSLPVRLHAPAPSATERDQMLAWYRSNEARLMTWLHEQWARWQEAQKPSGGSTTGSQHPAPGASSPPQSSSTSPDPQPSDAEPADASKPAAQEQSGSASAPASDKPAAESSDKPPSAGAKGDGKPASGSAGTAGAGGSVPSGKLSPPTDADYERLADSLGIGAEFRHAREVVTSFDLRPR